MRTTPVHFPLVRAVRYRAQPGNRGVIGDLGEFPGCIGGNGRNVSHATAVSRQRPVQDAKDKWQCMEHKSSAGISSGGTTYTFEKSAGLCIAISPFSIVIQPPVRQSKFGSYDYVFNKQSFDIKWGAYQRTPEMIRKEQREMEEEKARREDSLKLAQGRRRKGLRTVLHYSSACHGSGSGYARCTEQPFPNLSRSFPCRVSRR
jgi:hypothetical protein